MLRHLVTGYLWNVTRHGPEAVQSPTAVLIGYGLYIGTVGPFLVVVALGIVRHLREKMQARKQIQRLRDLYRWGRPYT